MNPAVPDVEFWKFVGSQSGYALVTFVVLWFYRRDFRAREETQASDRAAFVQVIKDNTVAMTDVKSTVAHNTMAIQMVATELRNSLEDRRRS